MRHPLFLFASTYLYNQLVLSQCASFCGIDNQFCCESDQVCVTSGNNVAQCVASSWLVPITSTSCSAFCGVWEQITETEIRTTLRVYSKFVKTGCIITSTSVSISTPSSTLTSTSTLPPISTSTSLPTSTSLVLICPTGYYMCDASKSLGCCPIGFECGDDLCTRAPSSTPIPIPTSNSTSTPLPTTASCNFNLSEIACGSTCCSSGQFCITLGQCVSTAVAPVRPTSVTPTTTAPFQPPAT